MKFYGSNCVSLSKMPTVHVGGSEDGTLIMAVRISRIFSHAHISRLSLDVHLSVKDSETRVKCVVPLYVLRDEIHAQCTLGILCDDFVANMRRIQLETEV